MAKKKTKEKGEKVKKKRQIEKKSRMPTSRKQQISSENRILRNFFISVGIIVVVILLAVFIFNSINSFEVEDVKFKVVNEGDLVLYNTQIPVVFEGRDADYNFYLRNDPRKLIKEVSFNGQLIMLNRMVINSTGDFNCNGDGVIAVANLANLYGITGAKVIRDENATCDSEGRYMFINLQEGNTTSIRQTGLSCYEISINNCEILKGTERFMVETFIEMNKLF